VLVVTPWTAIWDRNFFALTQPWLGAIMANGFVRGGVSGIGILTAVTGLRDLTDAILRRPAATHTPEAPPPAP
jgi:hypothetical protein